MAEKLFTIYGDEFPVGKQWRAEGRTIHAEPDPAKGDRTIGMMDSRELAAHVVTAVNAYNGLLQEIAKLRQDADVFQDEFNRLNKSVKDSAEAMSFDFVSRLTDGELGAPKPRTSTPADGDDLDSAAELDYYKSESKRLLRVNIQLQEAHERVVAGNLARIDELEQKLAECASSQKSAADSAVNAVADIISVVAAGIRKLDDK